MDNLILAAGSKLESCGLIGKNLDVYCLGPIVRRVKTFFIARIVRQRKSGQNSVS